MKLKKRIVFFFKQKTAYEMRISDWSSDVCSSDLRADAHLLDRAAPDAAVHAARAEPARIGRGPTDSEPQRQRRDERDQLGEREQQPMALRQSRKPHLAALRTVIRAETVRLARGWMATESIARPFASDRKSTRLNSSHKCATR